MRSVRCRLLLGVRRGGGDAGDGVGGGWFGALSLAVGQLLCSQQSEPILEM